MAWDAGEKLVFPCHAYCFTESNKSKISVLIMKIQMKYTAGDEKNGFQRAERPRFSTTRFLSCRHSGSRDSPGGG